MVHHLVEQTRAQPLEVDLAADRSPPQVEVRDRLLEDHPTLVLRCRLNSRWRFEPKLGPGLLYDSPYNLTVVSR